MLINNDPTKDITFEDFKTDVLNDYKIAYTSRECSLLGRREVLTGKAKFGIFGDGKELPQIAWAKAFQKGDFRSGYYRDQTFMMAIGKLSIQQFFAGLYAHTDITHDPMSAGRQMGGHFTTHSLDEDFKWKNLTEQYNSSSDISPTGAQMPRLLGLAQASKVYRQLEGFNAENFSKSGNEVAWGTIGNASTSEGVFFETINAAGVLQVPMVISIWDDEYGISVHAKHQTTKENISEILKGFQRDSDSNGYEILRVHGWDYVELINAYQKASEIARNEHVPVMIHVNELTQPQGHSTSGSHERYKSTDRLKWEQSNDCNSKFREWIISNDISNEEDIIALERSIKKSVKEGKQKAWKDFCNPIQNEKTEVIQLMKSASEASTQSVFIQKIINQLESINEPLRNDILSRARNILKYLIHEDNKAKNQLVEWVNSYFKEIQPKYSSLLYSESEFRATNIAEVLPVFDSNSKLVDGRVILRDNFEKILGNKP